MNQPLLLAICTTLGLAAPAAAQRPAAEQRAAALIERGIARMGGEAALRGVTSLRLEVLTQWQRTTFGDHPYNDAPSFERSSDLRDYATRSWRNTRSFLGATTNPPIVDLVRDTVGARWTPQAGTVPARLGPLNVAYVDERRELFAFASDRLLLAARDAGNARAIGDTVISGSVHGRFTATVDGYPATYFMRQIDGLPAMVRFRADETNDFGLAPWGMMEVEFWYSGWTRLPPGVLLARQLDVRRVGRPCKRMTLLSTVVNPPVPADSFAIPDSTVIAFFTTQNRPMWDAPLDSATITADHFASFSPWFGVGGAVRLGDRWVLLETGQAGGAARLVSDWLSRTAPGTSVGAGIVAQTGTSNGGVTWFADQKLPFYVSPGGATMIRTILGGTRRGTGGTTVASARWIRVGGDSLWLEPLDLPNVTGMLAVYSPTHRWLYAPLIGAPMYQADFDALIGRWRGKGWPVEWMGGPRGIRTAVPVATP